jgi:hypothetical protein
MAICVKIWLHSIFVWNILNVWKYGHLWKNLTFIGYLCEICSIWDNMAIWCLGSISDAMCAVSEALYSVSDGCYTESSNCSVSNEQKGRHTLTRRISHMRKRATHVMGACLPFTKHAQKRMSMNYCPRCASCTSTRHGHLHMCVCARAQMAMLRAGSWSTTWSTSCLRSLKLFDYRGIKSWWSWVLVGEVWLNL